MTQIIPLILSQNVSISHSIHFIKTQKHNHKNPVHFYKFKVSVASIHNKVWLELQVFFYYKTHNSISVHWILTTLYQTKSILIGLNLLQ